MPKEISLQNGMKAIVDDEDFERVNRYLWSIRLLSGTFLFVFTDFFIDKKRIQISLHQFILNTKPERTHCIIFENDNRLDFRKSNLKVVSRSYAMQRCGARKNSSSKYKGVSWNNALKKWGACIYIDKKAKFLGLFDTEEAAALIYNEAALLYFGDHAFQNILYEENIKIKEEIPKALKRRNPENKAFDSKYRGVTKAKGKGKWMAKIKNKSIGVFNTEEEAAMAYNVIAAEIFGEKAVLNDIK